MGIISEKDKIQLRKMFADLQHNIKILYFTNPEAASHDHDHDHHHGHEHNHDEHCHYCEATQQILEEVTGLTDGKVQLVVYDIKRDTEIAKKYGIDKIPATVFLGKDDKDFGMRFYGIPSGYEFATLVEDIIDLSKGTTRLTAQSKEAIKKVDRDIHIQVFITPTCPYCPKAARLGHQLAMENEHIRADVIEAIEFPDLANNYGVYGVPKTVINDVVEFEGAVPERDFVNYVLEANDKNR